MKIRNGFVKILFVYSLTTVFVCQNVLADVYAFPEDKLTSRSRWSRYWNSPKHQLDERNIDGFIYASNKLERTIENAARNRLDLNEALLPEIVSINTDLKRLGYDMSISMPASNIIPVLSLKRRGAMTDGDVINIPYLVFLFGSKERIVMLNLEPELINLQELVKIGIKEEKDFLSLKVPGTEKIWIADNYVKFMLMDIELRKIGFRKIGGDNSPYYLLDGIFLVEADITGGIRGIKNLFLTKERSLSIFRNAINAQVLKQGIRALTDSGFREVMPGVYIKAMRGFDIIVLCESGKITYIGESVIYVMINEDTAPEGYNIEKKLLRLRNGFMSFEISSDDYVIHDTVNILREPRPEELGITTKGIGMYKQNKDPVTGFNYGGVNSSDTIRGLTQLNGITIAELEKRMRPGRYSDSGFIGVEESLLDVLVQDNDFVLGQGLTHQQIVLPLIYAMKLYKAVEATDLAVIRKVEFEFSYKGRRYKMTCEHWPSAMESPFNDGYSQTDFTITNLENGNIVKFSSLVPFYIWRYGFYEGQTSHRVDPRLILSVFPLKERGSKDWKQGNVDEETQIHPVIRNKITQGDAELICGPGQIKMEGDSDYRDGRTAEHRARFENARDVITDNLDNILNELYARWDTIRADAEGIIQKYGGSGTMDTREKLRFIINLIINRLPQANTESPEEVRIAVLKGIELIEFIDEDNFSVIHSGEKRNVIYMPDGAYESIMDNPIDLAGLYTHEICDIFTGGHTELADILEKTICGVSLKDKFMRLAAKKSVPKMRSICRRFARALNTNMEFFEQNIQDERLCPVLTEAGGTLGISFIDRRSVTIRHLREISKMNRLFDSYIERMKILLRVLSEFGHERPVRCKGRDTRYRDIIISELIEYFSRGEDAEFDFVFSPNLSNNGKILTAEYKELDSTESLAGIIVNINRAITYYEGIRDGREAIRGQESLAQRAHDISLQFIELLSGDKTLQIRIRGRNMPVPVSLLLRMLKRQEYVNCFIGNPDDVIAGRELELVNATPPFDDTMQERIERAVSQMNDFLNLIHAVHELSMSRIQRIIDDLTYIGINSLLIEQNGRITNMRTSDLLAKLQNDKLLITAVDPESINNFILDRTIKVVSIKGYSIERLQETKSKLENFIRNHEIEMEYVIASIAEDLTKELLRLAYSGGMQEAQETNLGEFEVRILIRERDMGRSGIRFRRFESSGRIMLNRVADWLSAQRADDSSTYIFLCDVEKLFNERKLIFGRFNQNIDVERTHHYRDLKETACSLRKRIIAEKERERKEKIPGTIKLSINYLELLKTLKELKGEEPVLQRVDSPNPFYRENVPIDALISFIRSEGFIINIKEDGTICLLYPYSLDYSNFSQVYNTLDRANIKLREAINNEWAVRWSVQSRGYLYLCKALGITVYCDGREFRGSNLEKFIDSNFPSEEKIMTSGDIKCSAVLSIRNRNEEGTIVDVEVRERVYQKSSLDRSVHAGSEAKSNYERSELKENIEQLRERLKKRIHESMISISNFADKYKRFLEAIELPQPIVIKSPETNDEIIKLSIRDIAAMNPQDLAGFGDSINNLEPQQMVEFYEKLIDMKVKFDMKLREFIAKRLCEKSIRLLDILERAGHKEADINDINGYISELKTDLQHRLEGISDYKFIKSFEKTGDVIKIGTSGVLSSTVDEMLELEPRLDMWIFALGTAARTSVDMSHDVVFNYNKLSLKLLGYLKVVLGIQETGGAIKISDDRAGIIAGWEDVVKLLESNNRLGIVSSYDEMINQRQIRIADVSGLTAPNIISKSTEIAEILDRLKNEFKNPMCDAINRLSIRYMELLAVASESVIGNQDKVIKCLLPNGAVSVLSAEEVITLLQESKDAISVFSEETNIVLQDIKNRGFEDLLRKYGELYSAVKKLEDRAGRIQAELCNDVQQMTVELFNLLDVYSSVSVYTKADGSARENVRISQIKDDVDNDNSLIMISEYESLIKGESLRLADSAGVSLSDLKKCKQELKKAVNIEKDRNWRRKRNLEEKKTIIKEIRSMQIRVLSAIDRAVVVRRVKLNGQERQNVPIAEIEGQVRQNANLILISPIDDLIAGEFCHMLDTEDLNTVSAEYLKSIFMMGFRRESSDSDFIEPFMGISRPEERLILAVNQDDYTYLKYRSKRRIIKEDQSLFLSNHNVIGKLNEWLAGGFINQIEYDYYSRVYSEWDKKLRKFAGKVDREFIRRYIENMSIIKLTVLGLVDRNILNLIFEVLLADLDREREEYKIKHIMRIAGCMIYEFLVNYPEFAEGIKELPLDSMRRFVDRVQRYDEDKKSEFYRTAAVGFKYARWIAIARRYNVDLNIFFIEDRVWPCLENFIRCLNGIPRRLLWRSIVPLHFDFTIGGLITGGGTDIRDFAGRITLENLTSDDPKIHRIIIHEIMHKLTTTMGEDGALFSIRDWIEVSRRSRFTHYIDDSGIVKPIGDIQTLSEFVRLRYYNFLYSPSTGVYINYVPSFLEPFIPSGIKDLRETRVELYDATDHLKHILSCPHELTAEVGSFADSTSTARHEIDYEYTLDVMRKRLLHSERPLKVDSSNRPMFEVYRYTDTWQVEEKAIDYNAEPVVIEEGGAIWQGGVNGMAWHEFKRNREAGKYKLLDGDLLDKVRNIAGELGISIEGIKVFAIHAIVKRKNDFLYGYFDVSTNELFLAVDTMKKTIACDTKYGTKLLNEYIEHELKCRGINHQELRHEQRQKYQMNYKPIFSPEGGLRDLIREDIDLKVIGGRFIDSVIEAGRIKDKKIILAFDTDIGNLSDQTELLEQIRIVSDMLGNINFVSEKGANLLSAIDSKINDLAEGRDNVEVVLVTNKGKKKFRDSFRVMRVDDSKLEGYVPVVELLTFALRINLAEDSGGLKEELEEIYYYITREQLTDELIEQIRNGLFTIPLPSINRVTVDFYNEYVEFLRHA